MSPSPLGRYSDIAATVIAISVIVAWIAIHAGLLPTADGPAVDVAATLVIGVVLGQRATTNGAGKLALAAHRRLDLIQAPAADGVPAVTPVPAPAQVDPPAGPK